MKKQTFEEPVSAGADPVSELGATGLKVWSGVVYEEFLPALQGLKGVKIFREMGDNDATVGAVLMALSLVLRRVRWDVEASDSSAEAKLNAEFALSLLSDMSHTWDDFMTEVLSLLQYGWAYTEIVLKNRVGPQEKDPSKRSKFTDGRIGIRKLALRSQDTLSRWQMQDDGGILGLWQLPPTTNQEVFIPIERALLFRSMSRKNNPEGVSMLRTAYRSWFFLKRAQESEAIGIERELAGIPVAMIPAKYLKADASAADQAFLASIKEIVRDIKFNQQGGIVIPGDPYFDVQGNPTSTRQVELKLMTSGGQRSINPDLTIRRYESNIARSVLADFLMLGQSAVGSYALSHNKSSFFLRACEAVLSRIADPLNLYLLPRIWDINGLNRDKMPQYKPGQVSETDLDALGSFIRNVTGAGYMAGPDDGIENVLREAVGVPLMDSAGEAGSRKKEKDVPGGKGKKKEPAADDEELLPEDRNKANDNHDERGRFATGDGGGGFKGKDGRQYTVSHKLGEANGEHHYEVFHEGKFAGEARLSHTGKYVVDLGVTTDNRKNGIATALYDHIEEHLGYSLVPSPTHQTEAGQAFWASRKKK